MRTPESEYEFWTFRQFNNALKGFYEAQEARERQEWERVRWSTSVLLNVQLDKKSRIEPDKLLPLPWDAETKVAAEKTKRKGISEATREKWRKWDEKVKNLPVPEK